jgi:hypothetical protein
MATTAIIPSEKNWYSFIFNDVDFLTTSGDDDVKEFTVKKPSKKISSSIPSFSSLGG